ncbi:MAG: DUF362 domain-containing protein [Anaerolineales bacterium]
MGKFTRRDFLKAAAAGAGAMTLSAFLEACGRVLPTSVLPVETKAPAPQQPSQGSASQATRAATESLPSATAPAPTGTSVPIPDIAVIRAGEPEVLVRQAITALGGISAFVPNGANVVVKPNICVAYHTYEYAATTNPWVVGTVVKMCYEAGAASVKVMDHPFGGTDQEAYKISGIKEQVEAAGGEMVRMISYHYVDTKIPDAVYLKTTKIYDEILNADVLINVPIAKQHSSSGLTLGMKNLMGAVWIRETLHNNLHQSIADLNSLLKPKLTVLDAVRILTRNGPTGGNLSDVQQKNTVIASRDVVAVDSLATSLFGMKPEDLEYIRIGTSMGLGRSDLQNLNIQIIQLDA